MPDPPGPSARQSGVVIAVALVAVAMFFVVDTAVTGSLRSPAPLATEAGPFTLSNSTPGITLEYPLCSWVSVTWQVETGGPANFTVWGPPVANPTRCTGPPPTNASCPPAGCPLSGVPVCSESGYGGTCGFTATAAEFTFYLDAPKMVGDYYYNAVGNTTVQFATLDA